MVLKALYIHFLMLIGILFLPDTIYAENNLATISKNISKELKIDRSTIEFEEWDFACKTSTDQEEYYKFLVRNELKGYLVLTKAKGRYDYFDFFVLYNPDSTVCLTYVTSYLSDHGGEITSKKWLSQFIGYKGDELIYGRDIDAIAGATLSARSITLKVKMITGKIRNCNIALE